MFCRDGRTLPFVPVTVAAMDAIRDETTREAIEAQRIAAAAARADEAASDVTEPVARPYVTATYVALLESANSARAERAELSHRRLALDVGTSTKTIKQALKTLERARVVEVVAHVHAGRRMENEYVIVEPLGSELQGEVAAAVGGIRMQGGVAATQGGVVATQQSSRSTAYKNSSSTKKRTCAGKPLPVAEDVAGVFDEWVAVRSEHRGRKVTAVLGAARRKLIERAIESHGVEDVKLAVVGWRRSPHHCGENDGGTIYDSLELLLRNAGNIERFRDLELGARDADSRPLSAEEERKADYARQIEEFMVLNDAVAASEMGS